MEYTNEIDTAGKPVLGPVLFNPGMRFFYAKDYFIYLDENNYWKANGVVMVNGTKHQSEFKDSEQET